MSKDEKIISVKDTPQIEQTLICLVCGYETHSFYDKYKGIDIYSVAAAHEEIDKHILSHFKGQKKYFGNRHGEVYEEIKEMNIKEKSLVSFIYNSIANILKQKL